MFSSSKVSQSMIDAVNKVLGKEEPKPVVVETPNGRVPFAPAQPVESQTLSESGHEKVATPTGTKVYGSSYGNSKKARQDQTKSPVDALKGPKDKEMKEELKGNQAKIDANHNNKIDGQDFDILRGKKKVKESKSFAARLLETVRKSDVPAYLRKAKGDTPLTVADVKGPKKDSISAPENLAKNRNEEVEQIDEVSLKTATSAYVKRAGEDDSTSQLKAVKTISHIANKYGVKGVARAAKIADMEYGLNDPVHNKRKDFVKGVMSGVKTEEVEHLNEDDFAHAKKQGWSVSQHYHHTKVTHPKHGIVSVDRYGEWMHHPDQDYLGRPKGDLVAHGQFKDLNKHLSTLNEGAFKQMDIERQDREAALEKDGWKKMSKNVKDKGGNIHTPMSRARDLARASFNKIKSDAK